MKKIILTVAVMSSGTIFSQVGIGETNPSATLDIKSTGSTGGTKALEINNSDGTEIFTVNDNGNVMFKGALMPNNNPGTKGQYLVSKGLNLAPQWQDLVFPAGTKQIQEVFEVLSNGNSTSVPANTWRRIVLPSINLTSNPSIGTWSAANNEFTVAKNGLYIITAGSGLFTSTSDTADGGKMRIYSGGSYFEYGSLTTQCCSPVVYTDNSNGEIVVHLNTGDKIWIESQTTTSWVLDSAFIHIKYVEL